MGSSLSACRFNPYPWRWWIRKFPRFDSSDLWKNINTYEDWYNNRWRNYAKGNSILLPVPVWWPSSNSESLYPGNDTGGKKRIFINSVGYGANSSGIERVCRLAGFMEKVSDTESVCKRDYISSYYGNNQWFYREDEFSKWITEIQIIRLDRRMEKQKFFFCCRRNGDIM